MRLRVGIKNSKQTPRQRPSNAGRAPNAYSYSAQRSARPDTPGRQQPTTAAHRSKLLTLRFWIKRSGTIVAVIVCVICAISLLSLSDKPRVILLDEGNAYAFQEAANYEAAAQKHLSSSLWNRNKVTIDTSATAQALKQQFPEISKVSITLPLVGQRPIVYIQANAPAFVMQSINGTFVLDASGTSLIARDGVPEPVANDLPVITDQSGNRAVSGKQVISRSNAEFIQTVLTSLTQKKLIVESLVLPAGHVQQLDVRISGKPFIIKFDMHDGGGVRQQIGSYLALQKMLDDQSKTPSQYIDVRVLGRAYYL